MMTTRLAVPRMAAALAAVALVTAGCSEVRRTFGQVRSAPDEFSVVTRAPLTLPPGLGQQAALPEPSPGAVRPQEGTPEDQAARSVFGAVREVPAGARSSGENSILNLAGTEAADPDIRRKVDRETQGLRVANQFLVHRLLGIQPDPVDPVVNPVAETERMRNAAAVGEPVTAGETPVIERRRRGLFF